MSILSARITEAINLSDLKNVEIARRCGVSSQNITNWKTGQIRHEKLLILAKTLGTTVDWLLGDCVSFKEPTFKEPTSTTSCNHLRPDCWCKSNARGQPSWQK